ncbi:VacJ family lipoprotein [Crenothrix polyspora]|uniref:VacJ family lipoprotein n=1 Tax=Crenothrix polyspora TaxID=360316 RepID=A0A1R4GZY1_9GAMM|nr:VacJ family lipoprotein [Crenothrix polyspora]SJM89568.1 VacJ family lipoprotein [Crenothrix polyspora]
MNTLYTPHCTRTLQRFSLLLLAITSITLVGCATTHPGQNAANTIDPYENINRKIYTFNDQVDDYVAAPVANTYKKITPQVLQTGVFNFFNNLKNINVVLNDLMQAKFEQSAQDTGRFLMNSTVGIGGLFDVAKKVGLEQHEEDFEQTLAVWGVPQGTYLVLPILGPMTTRGIPGAVFDTAANPASYVGAPVQLVNLLNARANAEGSLKFIDEAALDPYVFTRESFLQWRKHLATDGKDQDNADATGYGEDLLDDDVTAVAVKPGSTATTDVKTTGGTVLEKTPSKIKP